MRVHERDALQEKCEEISIQLRRAEVLTTSLGDEQVATELVIHVELPIHHILCHFSHTRTHTHTHTHSDSLARDIAHPLLPVDNSGWRLPPDCCLPCVLGSIHSFLPSATAS